MSNRFLADFLGTIERSEASLLTWGIVDGFFTEQELIDRAEDFLGTQDAWGLFPDGISVLDKMVQLGLIFCWTVAGETRYRTRMGETVRLLARLKQLFPKHLNTSGAWRTAPNLVSDFRLVQRPREYPRRDIAAGDWTPQLNQMPLTPLQRKIAAQLVNGRNLAGFQTRAFDRIASLTGGDKASGTVVCAGTGSGKTLAFYLPTLTHLARTLEQDESHWVRALAIYHEMNCLKISSPKHCGRSAWSTHCCASRESAH